MCVCIYIWVLCSFLIIKLNSTSYNVVQFITTCGAVTSFCKRFWLVWMRSCGLSNLVNTPPPPNTILILFSSLLSTSEEGLNPYNNSFSISSFVRPQRLNCSKLNFSPSNVTLLGLVTVFLLLFIFKDSFNL